MMYMSSIREHFIKECIQIFKREDVHKEFNTMFKPLFQMILQEIYPYIIISMILVVISFALILGIFILLLRMIPKST
jgi:hypothetical protein